MRELTPERIGQMRRNGMHDGWGALCRAREERDALQRILTHADELKERDYRAALATWEQELAELMARKPQPPA